MKTTLAYKLKLYFLNDVVLNYVTSLASIQNEDLWYSLESGAVVVTKRLNDFPHFNPISAPINSSTLPWQETDTRMQLMCCWSLSMLFRKLWIFSLICYWNIKYSQNHQPIKGFDDDMISLTGFILQFHSWYLKEKWADHCRGIWYNVGTISSESKLAEKASHDLHVTFPSFISCHGTQHQCLLRTIHVILCRPLQQ